MSRLKPSRDLHRMVLEEAADISIHDECITQVGFWATPRAHTCGGYTATRLFFDRLVPIQHVLQYIHSASQQVFAGSDHC